MPVLHVRQSLLRATATLLLVVGVPMAWVATATAAAPTQAGWWFKLNAAATPEAPAAPLPAPVPVEVTATKPPTVPEGGLYIANDPSGPAAIAAVQLPADEGATGTLTLQPADGGAGEPLIVACPAVGVWSAEDGGPWEDRPDFDCDIAKVLGTVAEDGAVTFALDSSVAAPGGGFDVVLLPDPDSGTPFQAPFEAPGDDAWAPTGGTGTSEEEVTFTEEDLGGTDSGSDSFDSGGGAVDAGSGGGGGDATADFSTDAGTALDTSTPPLDAGAPAAEAPGAPLTATGEEVAATPAANATDDTGRDRAIAIGLLVALAAGLFFVSSRTGATAAGQAVAAGVGRFARPRSGRPNGLS